MNALHLIWIIPLSALFGFAIAAMLSVAREKTEAEYWRDAFEAALKLHNTTCDYAQKILTEVDE